MDTIRTLLLIALAALSMPAPASSQEAGPTADPWAGDAAVQAQGAGVVVSGAATEASAATSSLPALEARLGALERRVAQDEHLLDAKQRLLERLRDDFTASDQRFKEALGGKWYERLSLRGYTQLRTTSLFGQDNTPDLHVPADRSVGEQESFQIRRGRLVLSGDVTEHLFLYAQLDFNASVGGSGDTGLQMRDLYADIALDPSKEFRFRAGQSKVPYGFVNMQSSQNRAGIERPDALNSAVEGERDVGVFFYWAPAEVRDLFRHLVRSGLKGSGDYGVIGFGAYSGQGLNRSDKNGEVHWIARASCPFEVWGGQIVELGVQGYTGKFVPTAADIGGTTPTFDPDGLLDERMAFTAVLYPQPFGIEAEWNFGRGPELAQDFGSIGVSSLSGGYVQLGWLVKQDTTTWFPFTRWNQYDGGRKFGSNAPRDVVEEWDLGIEWSPWPEIEIAVMYTHTFQRTNTAVAPYDRTLDADRIGFQLQFNY